MTDHRRTITKESVARAVSAGLCGIVPKIIARRVPVTDRTARNWKAGRTEPSGTELLLLMHEFDTVFDNVIALSGRAKITGLSPSDVEIVRQALALIGDAIPANSDAPSQVQASSPSLSTIQLPTPSPRKELPCRPSSYPRIAAGEVFPISRINAVGTA